MEEDTNESGAAEAAPKATETPQTTQVKIGELKPTSRRIDVLVNVIQKQDEREVSTRDGGSHKVADFLVGDETGCIILSLWDADITKIEPGKVYKILNGYVTVFQNSMRISTGKYGSIAPSDESVEVNTDNNMSDKQVENPRRRFTRGGSSGGYGGRGGGRGGGSGGGFGDFGSRGRERF